MLNAPDIESILSRLMPPALSQDGQHEIESMLEELAGSSASATLPRPRGWPLVGGIAAAIAAAIVGLALVSHSFTPTTPSAIVRTVLSDAPAFELVGESDRVEDILDDGWRESPDGSAMRAMRLRVVEENSLLDHETGIVMRITEPRDELLLMPVSTF